MGNYVLQKWYWCHYYHNNKNHKSLVENDQKSMSNMIWCKNRVWGEGVVGYIMPKVYELKTLCLKGPRGPYWAPSIIPRGLSLSCQFPCALYGSSGIKTSLEVDFNTSQISKVEVCVFPFGLRWSLATRSQWRGTQIQREGWLFDSQLWNLLYTWRKNQEPTHCKVSSKPHLAPRGSLSKILPTGSNSRRIGWRCIIMTFL